MSWGSTSTQKTNQQQSQSGQYANQQTPVQLPWAAALQQSLVGPYQQLLAGAEAPVYGQAQKADYLSNLNDLANNATKHLASTLAGRGALDSGALATGQSGIEQQRLGQASSFFQNLPFQEAQAHQQRLAAALGLGGQLSLLAPVGQDTSGTSSSEGQSSGTTTTTQSPGLGSMLGGLLGAGLSAFTGGLGGSLGSSLFGGGGIGAGSFLPTYNPFQTSQGIQTPGAFTSAASAPPPVNWVPAR